MSAYDRLATAEIPTTTLIYYFNLHQQKVGAGELSPSLEIVIHFYFFFFLIRSMPLIGVLNQVLIVSI